jgi:hypothetical protein
VLLPRVSLADDDLVVRLDRCSWCRLPGTPLVSPTVRCVSLQLDLPEYPSKEELKVKLQRALEEQAFGLA